MAALETKLFNVADCKPALEYKLLISRLMLVILLRNTVILEFAAVIFARKEFISVVCVAALVLPNVNAALIAAREILCVAALAVNVLILAAKVPVFDCKLAILILLIVVAVCKLAILTFAADTFALMDAILALPPNAVDCTVPSRNWIFTFNNSRRSRTGSRYILEVPAANTNPLLLEIMRRLPPLEKTNASWGSASG